LQGEQGWKLFDINFMRGNMQPLLGFVLPLAILYVWEMRDRWLFAKEQGIPVASLWKSVLQGLPCIIYDVAFHSAVGLWLFTDWIDLL
jgi:hypothetical protein